MIICLGPTPTMQRTMTFAELKLDSVNRAKAVREYASGKSTNVARVLSVLGCDAIATGFLGGDRAAPFRADLDRGGVSHDFVEVTAPTRLCTTVIDESTGLVTELVEESHPVSPNDYQALLARVRKHLGRAALLVLSGTLPPSAEPDFYARCAVLADKETPVIVDAVGVALLEALKVKPFVIKPNQSELGRTLGVNVDSDESLRTAMNELVSRGASWVVVTRGRSDTLVTDGQAHWRVTTPAVKVISPIGSGDAFAAGLAAGLAGGKDVPEACVLGAACGAANALTPDSGHLRRDDAARLREQVTLVKT